MQVKAKVSALARGVPFYRDIRHKYEIEKLRRAIASAAPLNVVIGGGQTSFAGWIFTDRDFLDITNPNEWSILFQPNSIDRILCEHVLEHLSEEDCRVALTESYRNLKPGGLMRVAVPDGYRRDPVYVKEASPPKDGHQVLYNVDTLTALLRSAGFTTTPLEYFDAHEQFRAVPWDENDGFIQRSARFDTQQNFRRGNLFYTSLIVDARKP